LEVYKETYFSTPNDEGGNEVKLYIHFIDRYSAKYLKGLNTRVINDNYTTTYDYCIVPKTQIREYPKGAYIYNGSEWVHM
jgi:hypothetical protein